MYVYGYFIEIIYYKNAIAPPIKAWLPIKKADRVFLTLQGPFDFSNIDRSTHIIWNRAVDFFIVYVSSPYIFLAASFSSKGAGCITCCAFFYQGCFLLGIWGYRMELKPEQIKSGEARFFREVQFFMRNK